MSGTRAGAFLLPGVSSNSATRSERPGGFTALYRKLSRQIRFRGWSTIEIWWVAWPNYFWNGTDNHEASTLPPSGTMPNRSCQFGLPQTISLTKMHQSNQHPPVPWRCQDIRPGTYCRRCQRYHPWTINEARFLGEYSRKILMARLLRSGKP